MTSASKDPREPSVTLIMLDWSNSDKDQHIVLSAAEQSSTEVRVLVLNKLRTGFRTGAANKLDANKRKS